MCRLILVLLTCYWVPMGLAFLWMSNAKKLQHKKKLKNKEDTGAAFFQYSI